MNGKLPLKKNLDEDKVIDEVRTMVKNRAVAKSMKPMTLEDVAMKFGVTRQAISYILTKRGISVRSLRRKL